MCRIMITLYDYDMFDEYKDWLLREHGIQWDPENDEVSKYPYEDYRQDKAEYAYENMWHIFICVALPILVINDLWHEDARRITYRMHQDVHTVLDLFERIGTGNPNKVFYATDSELILEDNHSNGTNYHTFYVIEDNNAYKEVCRIINGNGSADYKKKMIQKYTTSAATIVNNYYKQLEDFSYLDNTYEDEDYRKLVMS